MVASVSGATLAVLSCAAFRKARNSSSLHEQVLAVLRSSEPGRRKPDDVEMIHALLCLHQRSQPVNTVQLFRKKEVCDAGM